MRTLIASLSLLVFSLSTNAHAASVWIEGVYGKSAVPMEGLNEYRHASVNKLENPDYAGASLGARFLFHTLLTFRYENQVRTLDGTAMKESVVYEPVSVNLDLPISLGPFMFTIGGGVGYALTFQYHQKQIGGTNEDVIWQAHPISARGRISLGYRLLRQLAVFGEVNYDSVKSELKAYKDYQTTVGGSPIGIGQELRNANGDKTVLDMSGLRFGVGLRLMF